MRKILILLPLFVLTSCANSEPVTQKTVEVTITEEETVAEASEPSSEQAPPAPAPVLERPVSQHTINAGQVGGICGYTVFGDEIRAYPDTSCEFAAAIFDVAYYAQYDDSMKNGWTLPRTVETLQVSSPVTGKVYPIDCFVGSDGRALICSDNRTQNRVGASYDSGRNDYWRGRISIN
ncbi:hypothetical protein [Corynebacterium hindlerae]|uniref:hypothetical protein n=1 Tax=Corynebacterium hindlerae TaxID=699041 RepID=UPI003AB0D714